MSRRAGWIGLGVTLVALTGVHLWGDALPELHDLFPEHRMAVDGTGTANDNTLTLTDARFVTDEGAPAGTKTLIVAFDTVPGADAGTCGIPRLVETQGAERTWVSSRSIPGWDSTDTELCGSDDGPARATIGFLVPDDIRDGLRVELPTGSLDETPIWFPIAL